MAEASTVGGMLIPFMQAVVPGSTSRTEQSLPLISQLSQCPHCAREIALQMSYASSVDVLSGKLRPPISPSYKDGEEPNPNSSGVTVVDVPNDDVQCSGHVSRDEVMTGGDDCDKPNHGQPEVAKKAHSKMSVVAFSDKVRCMDDHSWYEENLTYSDSDENEELDNEWDNGNGEPISALVCRQCDRVLSSKASRLRHERTQHGIIDEPVRTKSDKLVHAKFHKTVHAKIDKSVHAKIDKPTDAKIANQPVVNCHSPPNLADSSSRSPSTELQKKYSCDICNKKFSMYHLFMGHNRVHTGEKPFKCDMCSRQFAFKHHLGTHKLTHMNLKPYECPHCDRKFHTKPSQIRHSRSHFSKSSSIEETGPP